MSAWRPPQHGVPRPTAGNKKRICRPELPAGPGPGLYPIKLAGFPYPLLESPCSCNA